MPAEHLCQSRCRSIQADRSACLLAVCACVDEQCPSLPLPRKAVWQKARPDPEDARYARLVDAAPDLPLWEEGLRQQIYLGDDAFVARTLALADPARRRAVDVPRAQRRAEVPSLQQWLQRCPTRDQAMWQAYRSSGMRMTVIAAELGLSVSRVSRILAREELAALEHGEAKGKT